MVRYWSQLSSISITFYKCRYKAFLQMIFICNPKKNPYKTLWWCLFATLNHPTTTHRDLHIFTVYALHVLWNVSAFLKLKLPCVIINSLLQTEKKVIDRVSVLVLYLDWIVCLRSVWAVIAIQLGHFCKERGEITPNHLNQTLFSLFIQD